MRLIIAFFTNDRFVYTFIIINALALWLLGFAAPSAPSVPFWRSVEYGCVLYFLLEALFKIRINGWRAYWSNGWNRFDFIVLFLSLPVLMTPFIYFGDFRAATIVRLGRLFRLFRLLHIVPNRGHLAEGIQRAARASVGVFLGLFLVMLILALGATFLFGRQAPQYFGNPLQSFYTTFQVFTVEGWNDIPEAMVQSSSGNVWWAGGVRVFFMFSVLICGILGVSIANAVFVDEMMMDNNDELEEKVDELTRQVVLLRGELAQALTRKPPDPSA
jgi:voltage-gated sodium channel